MRLFTVHKTGPAFGALLVFLFILGVGVAPAQEELITEDSEFVHAMVRPAIAYLRDHHKSKGNDYGESALVGLAIYNGELRLGKSPSQLNNDPILIGILDEISAAVDTITPEGERTIYAAAVSGLLMAEMNAQKYSPQINKVLDFLYARQQPSGGFGYKGETAGDVSQTQYASLFFWLAKEKKFQVKVSAVENAIKFMIAVQKPSGGWPYKARPGEWSGAAETHSLTAAGLGSIYLLGDAFGLHGGSDVKNKKRRPGEELLPPSVSIVVPEDEPEEKTNKRKGPVRQIANFEACKVRGDAWFRNNFVVNPASWTYYYLYGFERYSSFKERAENVSPVAPRWYVEGAKWLKTKQLGDGAWLTNNAVEARKEHSTSFAILFLVRTTKLLTPSWIDLQEVGMVGLPTEGDIKISGGRVVNKTFKRDFDDMMSLIETATDTDWAAFESTFDSLVLDSKKGSRAKQMATLRKLVMEKNPVARKIAVKSIGKVRDFDNVPFLIYALSDPEPEIIKLANDGLRFISRKFKAQRVSAKPTKEEIRSLTSYWSDWYLTVEPEGRLIEVD